MKIKLISLISMLCFAIPSIANNVEGVVKDEQNEPIIGASIVLKSNKSVGTITNLDGQYTILVPDVKEETLIISYIGYKTRHIPLKGRTILDVKLEPDNILMDEVVVVGYGAVKKSDLTGAVSSIKSSDEEAARTATFDKMLQGKAAGVMVSTGSAEPGGAVSVRIRGTSSLRGNNSPLYVVDGNIISDTRVFAPNDVPVSYQSFIQTYQPWCGDGVFQNYRSMTFLKIRELSLTYGVPKSACDWLHIKGASVSFIGQNLLLWAKEFKYADPDVDGDDLNSPSQRFLGFNVKIDF